MPNPSPSDLRSAPGGVVLATLLRCSRLAGAAALLLTSWAGPTAAVEEIPQFRTRNQAGCHTSGIYPATRRIQNLAVSSGYSVDLCPGTTTVFRAPLVVLNSGFRAQSGSTFVAGMPAFPVHAAVLHPGAAALDDEAEFEAILATLNEQFVSEHGEQLIDFRLRSFTSWQAIDDADLEWGGENEDPCVQYVQSQGDAFDSQTFTEDYFGEAGAPGSCSWGPTVIRDPQAVNLYVYDLSSLTGHGRRNGGYPWIILEIDRLANPNVLTRQAPEAHEMGHAFGCAHVYDDTVEQRADDSNLMGSKGCDDDQNPIFCQDTPFTCPISGGNRLEGLAHTAYAECSSAGCGSISICQRYQNDDQPRIGQTQLVLWYAEEIARNFGLPHSWSGSLPIRLPCGETTCSHYPP